MQYSLSTLRKKANEAGYSFQKGYQRYNHDGWGYVHTLMVNESLDTRF